MKSGNILPVSVTCTAAKTIDFFFSLFDEQCVIALFPSTAKSGAILRNVLLLHTHISIKLSAFNLSFTKPETSVISVPRTKNLLLTEGSSVCCCRWGKGLK